MFLIIDDVEKKDLPATLRAVTKRLGGFVGTEQNEDGELFARLYTCDGSPIIDHKGEFKTRRKAVAALSRAIVSDAKAVLRADGWEFSE